LRETGIELVVEAPGPLWVVGDAARLAQAVSNLVQNAAAFTPRDGRVTVTAASTGERASVVVRDTGSGIAAELLPHVFDAFARAEGGPQYGRGGLGLMLVKGVVELHGGQVYATSAGPGQGSEFGFWLPLAQEERPGGPPAVLPEARRLRILVVEDHRDSARTLRILLVHGGHEVALAYTGKEGVAAAREWRPDVVLCDLGLPEMDGFEVARTLRRQPETAGCRLIAISGYGQEGDRRRCKEVGFDLHLTKPVDPGELQRVLASLTVRS
jgi:CheY-like chemotaxis protein